MSQRFPKARRPWPFPEPMRATIDDSGPEGEEGSRTPPPAERASRISRRSPGARSGSRTGGVVLGLGMPTLPVPPAQRARVCRVGAPTWRRRRRCLDDRGRPLDRPVRPEGWRRWLLLEADRLGLLARVLRHGVPASLARLAGEMGQAQRHDVRRSPTEVSSRAGERVPGAQAAVSTRKPFGHRTRLLLGSEQFPGEVLVAAQSGFSPFRGPFKADLSRSSNGGTCGSGPLRSASPALGC